MKKLVIIGAVALLSACGSKTETTPAPSDAAMGAAPAPAMGDASAPAMAVADANKLKTGVFDFTMADGKIGTTVITPAGSFVMRDDKGKVIGKGKVAMKDGKTCFTGEDGKEECHQDGPVAADGSFDVTTPDGKVGKVTPHKKK